MKIGLISPYDFAYPGGVANHIFHLDHYLTRMGHEVRVIAPASHAVPQFGDRFIPIGKPRPIPSSGSITRITISPWLSSRIKRVLEEEKFDIIHLHEPLMPMLCTTVLRLSKTANVGTFHAYQGWPGYTISKPLGFLLLCKWFRRLHGKIAVSEPARAFACEFFPGDYRVIPNGVDTKHFSPDVPPIERFCDGKLNILFVGRLEKRKGVNYLLKAYRMVKNEVPNCRLIIVGPGTRLRRKYEKYTRRNHLADVFFIGPVSYDELPRYYKTADVFCAPALNRESFGIVLLEAMAMGKPVVASNIGGYALVVSHGIDGLLVPPRDERGLAQALTSLMANESRRQEMGARGIIKAQEYDWENIGKRVLELYLEILGASPEKTSPVTSDATPTTVNLR